MITSGGNDASAATNTVGREKPQEQIDQLRTAADEAAKYVVRRYTTFILVSVYLAITVGSTTDEQLLRESRLPLPLLGVGLPIVPFYAVMPALYLLLHVNLLLQLCLLSRKLAGLASLVRSPSAYQEDQQQGHCNLIYPFPFSYVILRMPDQPLVRALLKVAVWTTVIVLPVLLLCWVQRQFLPYHSQPVTWWHRLCIFSDIAAISSCWPLAISTESALKRGKRAWPIRAMRLLVVGNWRIIRALVPGPGQPAKRLTRGWSIGLLWLVLLRNWRIVRVFAHRPSAPSAGGFVVLFFSLFVATIPGELTDLVAGQWRWLERQLHRNLVVRERALVTKEPPAELLAVYHYQGMDLEEARCRHAKGINLRNRDLRFADFTKALLFNADLRNADLRNARIVRAKLHGADLTNAMLHRADLRRVNLRSATLLGAVLDSADLRWAELNRANLERADLRGAKLTEAKLMGANLHDAQLFEADLTWADLRGADLRAAELSEADLTGAKFTGASLTSACLRGANLSRAELHGVDLRFTELRGANLYGAQFRGTNVRGAQPGDLDLRHAKVELCDLRGIALTPPRPAWCKQPKGPLAEVVPDDRVHRAGGPAQALARADGDTLFAPDVFSETAHNLYDCPGLTGQSPESSLDEPTYNKYLAEFLTELACGDSWVAPALVSRARNYCADSRQRSCGIALARALLRKAEADDCNGLRPLSEDLLDELRKVANTPDEAKRQD